MEINKQSENLEKMSEGFRKIGVAMGDMADAIIEAFSGLVNVVWDNLKPTLKFLDKTMSRKRFVKLLMSQGIQRNEANKIAWEVHAKNGKYTLMDCCKAIKNKEEKRC